MPSTGIPSSSSSAVQPRRAVGVHRRRAAGEDQALGPARGDLLGADVVGQQLGEDAALAHAARDELRVLAAVVEDDDLVDRARDVDRGRLVGELGARRGLGDDPVLGHAAACSAGVFSRPCRSAAAPGRATRAAPRLPMPTCWAACSSLPSVCSDGRDHQLGAVELREVLVAAGRHRGAQRAHEVERAVVLVGGADEDLLERAVLDRLHARAARERRVERRHAPVEAAAGRLVGAGQRRADHHGVGAAGDRLGDVAAGAHAAVGDDLDVLAGLEHVRRARAGDVGDRRRLRDAEAEDAARRARGAGADADEHAGRAGAHEVQARVVAGAAADDDRDADLADELLEVQRRRVLARRARRRRPCPG